MSYKTPPDSVSDLPILQKSVDAYILWHTNAGNLSRFSRATIGEKIDALFTDILELFLHAGYAARVQKLPLVERAAIKLDALKYFLQIMHRCGELPDKKYLEISAPLHETGKMLGGWRKQLMSVAHASESSHIPTSRGGRAGSRDSTRS